MKRKGFALLAASSLLVMSAVPFMASAATGTIKVIGTDGLDKTRYSAVATGGFNIVGVQVADADLNVSTALTTANASGSGVVSYTPPGGSAAPFDLIGRADGAATTFTANKTPIADTSGDGSVNFADVNVRVLQTGDAPTVNNVNPSTGAITVLSAPAEGLASKFNSGAISADAGFSATAGSVTAITAASKLKITITHADGGTDGATSTVTVKYGCVSTDRNASGVQTVKTLTATATTYAGSFCTAFANTMDGSGTIVNVDGTASNALASTGIVAIYLDFTAGGTGDTSTVVLQETNTVAANYQHAIFNTTDQTISGTLTKTVKVTSGTNPTGVSLTAIETGSSTGVFQQRVALVKTADKVDLDTVISAGSLTSASTIAQLTAAINASASLTAARKTELVAWVNATILNLQKDSGAGLVALTTADTLDNLTSKLLTVSHGDTVTATYSDQSPLTTPSDTATIDLVAPTIAGVSPTDGTSTNDNTPLLTGQVTDADAGIDQTAIVVNVDAATIPSASVSKDPMTNGYTVQYISAVLAEGAHTWELIVTDRVGNMSTTTSSGAAGIIDFTIDTVKPTLLSAVTGTGIKLDAADVDTDGKTDDYVEFSSNEWIKVVFDEPLSASSVTASDFSISTGAAVDVMVKSAVSTSAGANIASAEKNVYVKVGTLAANAKPTVKLVDAVADKAGNASNFDSATTTTTQVTAVDGIKPTMTIAAAPSLVAKDGVVTFTATSDETLAGTPSVVVDKGTAGTTTVGMVAGSTALTWTGTYKALAADLGEFVATATGIDTSSAANTGTKTVKFEADDVKPVITFGFTLNKKFETSDVVFLPVMASDDESATASGSGVASATNAGGGIYTKGTDNHTKTTIVSGKLDKLTTANGATVSSTTALTAADFQSADGINYIYGAKTPAVGFYRLTVVVKDDAGNEQTGSVLGAFEVIERQPVTVSLNPGWNLISLPERPVDPSLETIFADPKDPTKKMTTLTQVFSLQGGKWLSASYDAATGTWDVSGGLTSIQDGFAYYVRSTSFQPIKYMSGGFSPVSAQPTYPLRAGWNGVGVTIKDGTVVAAKGYFASLGTKWTTARVYNVTTSSFATLYNDTAGTMVGTWPDVAGGVAQVASDKGYFVYVTENVILAP